MQQASPPLVSAALLSEGAANRDRSYAWRTLAMLCALYAISMLDRMMPALLVGGLRVDMDVSPLQFGLLIGTGFGLLYAAIGVPAAHWIDSGNRKWIVFTGVMLWSIATIASAAVQNYSQLVVARAGVAIGEAVLIPAGMSMIGDMFAGRDRVRATSFFAATGQIMGSALFLVGAGALTVASIVAPFADIAEWRMAFLIIGIPPALIGIGWIWLTREPPRPISATAEGQVSNAAALQYISAHRRLYGGIYAGVGLTSMIAFALLAWLPTVLQRYGMSAAQAGTAMGLVGLVPTVCGAALSAMLASYLQHRGIRSAPILVGGSMLGLAILAVATTIGSGDATFAIIGFGCATFGFAGFYVTPMLVIQAIGPARMRARLTALNQLAVSAIGLALGPPAVALIASILLGDATALGPALGILALATGVPAVLAFLLAGGGYVRARQSLCATTASALDLH